MSEIAGWTRCDVRTDDVSMHHGFVMASSTVKMVKMNSTVRRKKMLNTACVKETNSGNLTDTDIQTPSKPRFCVCRTLGGSKGY